jgi:hypothetical protein
MQDAASLETWLVSSTSDARKWAVTCFLLESPLYDSRSRFVYCIFPNITIEITNSGNQIRLIFQSPKMELSNQRSFRKILYARPSTWSVATRVEQRPTSNAREIGFFPGYSTRTVKAGCVPCSSALAAKRIRSARYCKITASGESAADVELVTSNDASWLASELPPIQAV